MTETSIRFNYISFYRDEIMIIYFEMIIGLSVHSILIQYILSSRWYCNIVAKAESYIKIRNIFKASNIRVIKRVIKIFTTNVQLAAQNFQHTLYSKHYFVLQTFHFIQNRTFNTCQRYTTQSLLYDTICVRLFSKHIASR